MIPIIKQVANEYKAQLLKLYGNELVELILLGSYTRGDNHEESDVDFALVLHSSNIHTALLLTQNVSAKTHQGTRAKFSKLFIKTGIFSADIAGHIKNAFDLRQLIMILMQIFLKKLHWHLLLIQKNYTSYRSLTCEVCKYSSA